MTMTKGIYYIGDLCYVLNSRSWDETFELCFPNYPDKRNEQIAFQACTTGHEGEMQLKDGRKFAIFSTAYGDGIYDAVDMFSGLKEEHDIGVDSGSIGCIKVEDVDLPQGLYNGALVKLDDFNPYSTKGNMNFGGLEGFTRILEEKPIPEVLAS